MELHRAVAAPAGGVQRWVWLMLLLAGGMAAWLSTLGLAQRSDGQIHDLLSSWQPVHEAPAGITVIDIDERSLQEIGPWPWSREVIAELAHNLREKGARLQVWDMFFSHATSSDARLTAEMVRPDAVIGVVPVLDALVNNPPHEGQLGNDTTAPGLCSKHAQIRGYLGMAPALAKAKAGHLAATPDVDGRLRRLPAVLCLQAGSENLRISQLALAAAEASEPLQPWQMREGQWPWEPAHWLERGEWQFAIDQDGYLNIPYRRPHTQWPAVSASRVLLDEPSLPSLKGQIVLVGGTALGARDIVSTPFHPGAPGVSVHAELLAAAIGPRSGWGANLPRAPALMAAIITMLAGLWLIPFSRTGYKLTALVPGLAIGLLAPIGLAWAGRAVLGAVFPITAPVLALLAYAMVILALLMLLLRRQTQALAQHLQSFLPPRLAQQIATQLPTGQSLGQSHTGVLAAARVDGLARWVGRVDSLQSLALIHAVHTTALRTALQYGGQLEHAQGDTLYMSWPDASACAQALACMQELHRQLEPILEHNALEEAPLLFYAAMESGSYLLGVVGAQGGRRSVLLGPAANDVIGILDISAELDGPILLGPNAAQALIASGNTALQSLGQFLLFEQAGARLIYRAVN